MSSMVRMLQRTRTREKRSGKPSFGTQLGVHNPKHPPAPFPGAYLTGRVAKGTRRGKRNKAYIERRKALADA